MPSFVTVATNINDMIVLLMSMPYTVYSYCICIRIYIMKSTAATWTI